MMHKLVKHNAKYSHYYSVVVRKKDRTKDRFIDPDNKDIV
jgi:hypothetical protein